MQVQPTSPVPKRGSYVAASVIVFLIAMTVILLLELKRPLGQDNTSLYTMIIGFALSSGTAILALMKAQETHLSVNSRLDDFIRNAREAAHAEGMTEGQGMTMVSRTQGPIVLKPGEPPAPPNIGFKITSVYMTRGKGAL
jgi:uncharacterized membrane protein